VEGYRRHRFSALGTSEATAWASALLGHPEHSSKLPASARGKGCPQSPHHLWECHPASRRDGSKERGEKQSFKSCGGYQG